MVKSCIKCGQETSDNNYDYCITCYIEYKNNKDDYIEGKIKGTITETIVEEMFRKLGFFVLKLGKEITANPLNQIEEFINKIETTHKFKLERADKEYITPITYINRLPDFIIVSPSGKVELVEVKFRKNANLQEKDEEVFDVYENAIMLVANINASNLSVENKSDIDENIKNSRFQIWEGNINRHGEHCVNIIALNVFLKNEFNIVNDDLIKKYEDILVKWLGDKNGH